MAHIVQRKNRFYLVAYDGIDPLTGRERRRWHAVGDDPADADALVAPLIGLRDGRPTTSDGDEPRGFLTDLCCGTGRPNLRTTTAYRHGWMIEHYISPRLGDVPLRQLRDDHLDDLYNQLLACGANAAERWHPRPFTRST